VVDPVQLTETSPFRSFKKGTEGSNVFLSAIQSGLQRNSAASFRKSCKIAAIPQLLLSNRTGESVPLSSSRKLSCAFLWRADTQSGFSDSIRRMQCDHKPTTRRRALTFVRFRKPRSALPTSPFPAITVGVLERDHKYPQTPSPLQANRHMRDVLLAKGYTVNYREVAGGHEVSIVAFTLADSLLSLARRDGPDK
jgi:hypothetical protein